MAVDVADRVRFKSDRRTRGLILVLCLAPVGTPFLVAGLSALTNIPARAAPPAVALVDGPALRPTIRAPFDDALFSPAPMGAMQRLEQSAPSEPPAAAPARVRGGARVLRGVTIRDGFQIGAEGVVIALAGIAPAPTGSECRRLDGVVEPCLVRAANRLDLLTRGRSVVCDLQDSERGEMRGVCRAGKIDLADDLVRNGLAVRTSDKL